MFIFNKRNLINSWIMYKKKENEKEDLNNSKNVFVHLHNAKKITAITFNVHFSLTLAKIKFFR